MTEESTSGSDSERPLQNQIINLIREPLRIGSYSLPLYLVYRSVDALAGERTVLNMNVKLAIAFSLVAGGAALTQWLKARGASQRLVEQRERLERYERLNEELQQRNDRLEREIKELMEVELKHEIALDEPETKGATGDS